MSARTTNKSRSANWDTFTDSPSSDDFTATATNAIARHRVIMLPRTTVMVPLSSSAVLMSAANAAASRPHSRIVAISTSSTVVCM